MLLRGGRVIDPANGVDDVLDVLTREDGRIAAVDKFLGSPGTNCREIDCSDLIVVPGLIDIHIHGYQYATPLGIDVDEYCLRRGVTTAVDAGSSGASTFAGLKKFIAEKCQTRLLAFLHIALHGLASAGCAGFGRGGESDSLKQVQADDCLRCINENRDILVGVKVRLTADVCNSGKNETEAYERAMKAARVSNVPLMVHHSESTIPIGSMGSDLLSCPGSLSKGDIYTHVFHGLNTTIVDTAAGKLHSAVWESKRRGVLFDVGHGMGSFSWTVAELCAKEGFWPDLIGSDLHQESCEGPAYDLVTVMSKMLCVGMPLVDVITAATSTPAEAIGWADRIGSLTVGRDADITVLALETCDIMLEDTQGQMRRLTKRLIPKLVFKSGQPIKITEPKMFPNVTILESRRKDQSKLVFKDAQMQESQPKKQKPS
eukprot:m.7951 g.7951  ORF g.7951 m.7951 type:complete len:430 (+) comp20104_c0_seq2:30-1319(+)